MDFLVYDNIHTYNKMHPSAKHYPETDLLVKQVVITPWNSFWIETDFDREEHNININAPYVHLHKGTKSTNHMKFDVEPYYIPMQEIIYDPKKKQVIIYKPNSSHWNPWRKPLKIKNVKHNYYGNVPKKSQKSCGILKYDLSSNQIHIVLNFVGHTDIQKYPSED